MSGGGYSPGVTHRENGAMDVGDHGASARNVMLEFGNVGAKFRDVVANFGNGPMRTSWRRRR